MSSFTNQEESKTIEKIPIEHKPYCTAKHRRISTLLDAAMLGEKRKAYNCLASIMRECLMEIQIIHSKNNLLIAGNNSLVVEVFGEDKKTFILHESDEARYHILWTCDGVIEASDRFFNRFIEFNNIKAAPQLVDLGGCYCESNMVDFITLAAICESIIKSKAELIGITKVKRQEWHKKSLDSLKLAAIFKEAM